MRDGCPSCGGVALTRQVAWGSVPREQWPQCLAYHGRCDLILLIAGYLVLISACSQGWGLCETSVGEPPGWYERPCRGRVGEVENGRGTSLLTPTYLPVAD